MISIIVITKDNPKELDLTLKSLTLDLTLDLEINIIDATNGFIDQSKSVGKILINHYKQEGNGIYQALNQGISVSNGDYISWVNSGDECEIYNLIATQISLFESSRMWSYGGIIYQDENGNIRERFRQGFINSLILRFGLRFIPHPGSLFAKEFLLQHNLMYEEEIGYIADQVFLYKAWLISKPLSTKLYNVKMLINGISMKSSFDEKFQLWHMWRKNHGLLLMQSEKFDASIKNIVKIISKLDFHVAFLLGRRKFW